MLTDLVDGLYEALVTEALRERLGELPAGARGERSLDKDVAPSLLARYIHDRVLHTRDGSSVVLFVRDTKKDDRGETNPYVFLGPVRYVRHQEERPMQIVWRLDRPMPARFFEQIKVAAG